MPYYRSDAGLVDVDILLEELVELHDRIELGPHWDAIERIRINHIDSLTLPLEQQSKM